MVDIAELVKYTKNLTLLYVEDNPETRKAILSVLDTLFDNIIEAVDGVDGLEKYKNNPNIQIIISDINMPNMNGLEMSKKIKELNSDIPILIFSAHNEVNYFIDAIKIGIEGYLLKPLNLNQFINALSKCTEKLNLKKENLEYKLNLEEKVKSQIQDLRLKDKLLFQQSKMAAMGEMMDSIAHQWLQPINIINMKASILTYDFQDELIDKQYITNLKSDIYEQIQHITTTLDNFRSFFRPTTRNEDILLKTLIDSSIFLIKDDLIKDIIKTNITGNITESINVNINEFKHTIINIVNNAKDAFNDNNISKKNRMITFDIQRIDDKVSLTICDNAGGIPENIMHNIFELHFTTKEEGKGTGIGLYMTKQIIDKMGATISVSNNQDGAVFKIEL